MRRTWKRALTAFALAAPLAFPASGFAQEGGATGTAPGTPGSEIPDVGRPGEQAPKPPKKPDIPTDTKTKPEQLAPDTSDQPGRGGSEEQPAPREQEKQPKPESELND
jgi:hypothetical protein